MVKWREVKEEDWARMPTPEVAKKPSDWDDVLDELDADKIVSIELASPEKLKGAKIGLSRRAASRGFRLEFRQDDQVLVVRKSDAPFTSKAPKTSEETKKGRRSAKE